MANAIEEKKIIPDYDFIIIGSGFGGSVAALRLTEKNYRVLVVEAGKRYQPHEFAKTNWEIHKFLWMPRLFCRGILRLNFFKHLLVLSGSGVGGGSLVYGNTLLEPPPHVWKDPAWSRFNDWKAILATHYQTAKKMLGVTRNPYLAESDFILREGAKAMSCENTFKATDVGVFFGSTDKTHADPYFNGEGPERKACTRCGACMIGCRDGGKNTLDKNYLYLAEKKGLSILPETEITRIQYDEKKKIYTLSLRSSTAWIRRTKTLTCNGVVLSAGVLGSLRLLLQAKSNQDLPKLSDRIGENVITNAESLLGVTQKKRTRDFSQGIAIGSGISLDAHTHVEAVRYPKGSDVMGFLVTAAVKGNSAWQKTKNWILLFLKNPIRFLKNNRIKHFAESTLILLVMQSLPAALQIKLKRRLLLPWKKKLATSGNKIPASIPIANELAEKIASQIDGYVSTTFTDVFQNIPTTAHLLGGVPMGDHAGNGVIDSACRVFHYPNFYVCCGAIVTANLGVNPSLTITAMTEYAMSQIKGKPHE